MDANKEDGYIFKLDQLRGQLAALKREVKRMSENALEALQADPPFIPAVKERLEDIRKSCE